MTWPLLCLLDIGKTRSPTLAWPPWQYVASPGFCRRWTDRTRDRYSSWPPLIWLARCLLFAYSETYNTAADLIPPRPTLTKLRTVARDAEPAISGSSATQTVSARAKGTSTRHFHRRAAAATPRTSRAAVRGPAGALLDRALGEAKIDRAKVTSRMSWKHFKWSRVASVAIHKKPNAMEIRAVRPWLEAEIGV